MKEQGMINREISKLISEQGHTDLLMVCDAGFAIPNGVKVVDLSYGVNKPMVVDFLKELSGVFSVEKMFMANETKETSPSLFNAISKSFGEGVPVETIPQADMRNRSKEVKAIIRTGDFTAFGNVILVSGSGSRWYCEK